MRNESEQIIMKYLKFWIFGYRIGIRIGCKKHRFGSRDDARAKQSEGYRIHFCEFCEGFHLFERSLSRREIVVKAQEGKCLDCKKEVRLTIHHVKPISEGGSNELENLVAICRGCHDLRHLVCNKRGKRAIVREFKRVRREYPHVPNLVLKEKLIEKGLWPIN